jgi:hypothetical protein
MIKFDKKMMYMVYQFVVIENKTSEKPESYLRITEKEMEQFFIKHNVNKDKIFIKLIVRGDGDDDDEEDEEEEDIDDEYSRKRNLSEILSNHNIDDVLKEKILDDYFLTTIDMLAIQKAIKMKNLENKIAHCEDKNEDDEENDFDDDEDEFVEEDLDEDEYIRQRHERIDRKHNLSSILSKHNIDDAVLVEKMMNDYFYSMV